MGRTGCIGMLSSHNFAYSVHMPAFENGVIDELSRRGLYLAKDYLIEDADASVQLPRLAKENIADALLVNYAFKIPARLDELIQQHSIPAVWINSKQPHNAVRPDDYEAAARATRHLIELGHRHILYIDPTSNWLEAEHYSTHDRLAGYTDAMREAGLPPHAEDRPRVKKPSDYELGVKRVINALTRDNRPTAVLSPSNGMTVLLAAARCGLEVPRDLSVITFDNEKLSNYLTPMSRMVVPFEDIGRVAVETVCTLIDHADGPRPEQRLKIEFDDQGTAVPPPAHPASAPR
jgi:DNA-binding LacI/PurR family transcriptional regulator